MQTDKIIEQWPGIMVHCGLGTPCARAFTAATVTGVLTYLMKYPREAFRPDGSMRPHPAVSLSGDATTNHFLLRPLAVGGLVFLFT
tara:strand:+ start:2388 stop:2645 length:258 start_codon:yes stop_codon:yes gene_type:complete